MRRFLFCVILLTGFVGSCCVKADDKPPVEGTPLEKSDIETEQAIDLAVVGMDGAVKIVKVRLHWSPTEEASSVDDSVTFDLDMPPDTPGIGIFNAQLWNASLASAMAWQEPWLNAHWKVLGTPQSDGSGIEAGLAVGMITTSARRKFPEKTVILASLNPDGSLGTVSHIMERLKAVADAHMETVVISNLQETETAGNGSKIDVVQEAEHMGLKCYTAADLVEATVKTMKDPLPKIDFPAIAQPYSEEIKNYLNENAVREEQAVAGLIRFAPEEGELSHYAPYLSAQWKEIREKFEAGKVAMAAGEYYAAYRDFCVADSGLGATNAASIVGKDDFDVKTSISQADDLRKEFDDLLVHPAQDKGDLGSAMIIAEMSDWVREVESPLQGAEMLVKQTYSQRTDATDSEQAAARVRMAFCLEQAKKRMHEADFYQGLSSHLGGSEIQVESRADQYYGQLLPSELATAQLFFDQIREPISESGSTLLFDYRISNYVQVVRQAKALWETRLRQKEIAAAQKQAEESALEGPSAGADSPVTAVSFDPGNTYTPPRSTVFSIAPESLSQSALCLCWANDKCEIAMLAQKYLGLRNSTDPATLVWQTDDKARLDLMLSNAEQNARLGIALAQKTGVDTSLLTMIYENGLAGRQREDDLTKLDALRDFWRCALLGNLSWQLSFTPKAKPVDLGTDAPPAPVATETPVTPKTKTKTPKATPTHPPVATLDLNNIPVAPAVTEAPTPQPTATPAASETPMVPAPLTNQGGTATAPVAQPSDGGTGEAGAVRALPVLPGDLIPTPPSDGAAATPAPAVPAAPPAQPSAPPTH